jgi:VPDSG-CTERM motif
MGSAYYYLMKKIIALAVLSGLCTLAQVTTVRATAISAPAGTPPTTQSGDLYVNLLDVQAPGLSADVTTGYFANTPFAQESFNIGIDSEYNFSVGSSPITSKVVVRPVPDTATTLFLLGGALLGLEVIRRKFEFAK